MRGDRLDRIEATADEIESQPDIPQVITLSILGARELVEVARAARVMRDALERAADDGDYCYACDRHPSSGHATDCPVERLGEEKV